jgi:hypothetical protein
VDQHAGEARQSGSQQKKGGWLWSDDRVAVELKIVLLIASGMPICGA